MKKLLNILLLLPLLVNAQRVFQPVSETATNRSTGQRTIAAKLAERNLTVYPRTSVGDAAFLAALKAGTLTAVSAPAGAIVGRYSYNFSDSRTDFGGRSVISSPAPVLTPSTETRLVPRLVGNYYSFAPQLSLNVVLHKRTPTFTTHATKIVAYPAGLYSSAADNELIGRGWTHTTESAKWAGEVYPNYKRAIEFAFYNVAYQAAQGMSAGAAKQQLLDWAGPFPHFDNGPHILIDNYDACLAYAGAILDTWEQPDWKGLGVTHFSVNHEVHTARPNGIPAYTQYYRHHGLLAKAIIQVAAQRGKTLTTGLSDFGNIATYAPWLNDQPALTDANGNPLSGADPSIPRYMHYSTIDEPFRGSSQSAALGNVSDLADLVKTGKAYVGVGSYQQHTIDEQSIWRKNAQGKYEVDANGDPIFRTDERTATITGQQATIYNADYKMGIVKLYGYFARYAANQFFRAGGQHLPLSTARQSGWEATKFIRSFRIDAESESGLNRSDHEAINQRPLNPDWTETDAIGMYLFTDYMRGWMDSQERMALGADNGKGSKARAAVEIYEKGFYRASQLNWINDTPWRLVQPVHLLWKQGIAGGGTPDPAEHFARKPIMLGGLATKDGKPAIWQLGAWPCQDVDRYTDVVMWVDKDGVKSPGYRVRLRGRKPFLDWWYLPDNLTNVEPKHVYYQFTSLTGKKITWRGDYREARITNHPTPPAVQESALSGGRTSDPGNGGGGSTEGPPWLAATATYNATTKRLDIEADPTPDSETIKLRFARQDGQPLTGISSGGGPLQNGVDYFPGTLSGQGAYIKEWSWLATSANGSGIPAVPIVLTFTKTDGTSYTHTFTPANGTRTQLFTAATGGGGDDDPGDGGGGNPGDGSSDFVSKTDEGWGSSDAEDFKYLENSVIKVGFKRSVGATICYAAFKSGPNAGVNMVNDYQVNDARQDDYLGRWQKIISDKGRQWMQIGSLYWTPGNAWQVQPGDTKYEGPGTGTRKNSAEYGFDTGGNSVQGGSLANWYDESEILASKRYIHPKYGPMIYFKIKPRVWCVPREFVDIVQEGWVWLEGETATIGYYSRQHIGNITNPQMIYEARGQEIPCLYTKADMTHHRVVDQDATPWTNAGTVDRFHYVWTGNDPFKKAYATPECWMSSGIGANGLTVGLYNPGIDRGDGKRIGLNSRFNNGQFVHEFGNWNDNASSYINNQAFVNFDNANMTYDNAGYMVLGNNLAEVRSRINALPRPDQSFDYNFTTSQNTGWWNINCRAKPEDGAWSVYIGDYKCDGPCHPKGNISAPYGAWDATQLNTVEFDMAVSGATTLWFTWEKTGEEQDGNRQFRKAITVNGNGQRQILRVTTAGAGWDKTIAMLGLKAIRPGDNQGQPITPAGAKIKLYRVRKIN